MFIYRAVYLLYMVIAVVTAPMVCVLLWLALGQAKQRRLVSSVHWLTPAALGATFSAAGILLTTIGTLLRLRFYPLYALSYLLAAVGSPLHVCGVIRLWKMLRGLEPFRGNLPPDDPGPADDLTWPPPPSVRR